MKEINLLRDQFHGEWNYEIPAPGGAAAIS